MTYPHSQSLFVLLVILFISLKSKAQIDPLTGARVSLASTQNLLAAPPLPEFNTTKKRYSLQVSSVTAKVDGTDTYPDLKGKFEGSAVGLGYSHKTDNKLGYYGMAVFNDIKGKIELAGQPNLESFKTSGYAISVGGSLRLTGDPTSSIFNAGVFAGPAIMNFKSTFMISTDKFTYDPNIVGGLFGMQFMLRFGKTQFRPYALYFKEFSDECKPIPEGGNPLSGTSFCGDGSARVEMPATFTGFGLILGYEKFQLNVYSNMRNDSSFDDITLQHISLGYSF